MSARRSTATIAAGLLALTLATTACSGGGGNGKSGGGPVPTAWSAGDASNKQDKPGEQEQGGNRKVVPSATSWQDMKLAPDSAMVDFASWPDANELYASDQLTGMLPESKSLQLTPCSFGSIDGGGMTPKNANCTVSVKVNEGKYDDAKSKMKVHLRGIGADSEVTKAWDKARDGYRAENVSQDVFYQDGTYGARRALFRQKGLGSFVISDGQVAAWIDIEFVGFDFLTAPAGGGVGDVVRKQIFPIAVQDLVGKLPRKFA
ncbi:hypothetical protein [Luteipulveratus mongoliensis]|uniref:DUF3558 domain-containing protein n=1 Tax=Luteipulveratus mongoliensis TaxID=571913 RepID=A0A0K1JI50_9MICO|nr:hypothetical protein [Luteipulveratus mongoliensis]AKU16255.1 hypothetical protein VV02_10910 [Luteipulveratus mongoliensis]